MYNQTSTVIVPVILSGGAGTRLWPLSREQCPKQFHKISSDNYTMIQNTIKRYEGLPGIQPPIVICNHEHRFMVSEQLAQIGINNADILLEPAARNTAPAIAVAAHHAMQKYSEHNGNTLLLILSADHHIASKDKFCEAVRAASEGAAQGNLAVFGVPPSSPHTGYGYIKAGAPYGDNGTREVSRFVEKPNAQTAQKYQEEGGYYWNCGIFLFKASTLLEAMNSFCPEVFLHTHDAYKNAKRDLSFIALDAPCFEKSSNISIDYAVLEKVPSASNSLTAKVLITPLETQWSDIGSWDAIYDLSSKDPQKNAYSGDVLLEQSEGNYIRSEQGLVTTLGVKNLVIINTDDSLLVAAKSHMQDIKTIVERLKKDDRPEVKNYKKTYRPWGTSKTLERESNFQINRVMILPGQKMTMQSHKHRSEHWVILTGEASISRENETIHLKPGNSIEIPAGTAHRLSNPGAAPLEIIEVQYGNNIDDKDIVRYDAQ